MSCLQIAHFCLPHVIKKCIVFEFWILSVRRKGHFITKMAPSSCIKLLIPSVFFLTLLDQMIYELTERTTELCMADKITC